MSDEMSDNNEMRLYLSRVAHADTLTVGSRVRVTVGRMAGVEGVIDEPTNPIRAHWRDADGLGWTTEPHNLELVQP